MPLVSVIIPIYNVEKYLNECIDSVINQSYINLEIILVDDGSTDTSDKICDDYCANDSRISVIHKENGGQSSARNLGLKSANGDYIYFLDSDDYLEPDAIEILLNNATVNNSDIVYFEAESFTDSHQDIKQTYQKKSQYKTDTGFNTFKSLFNNNDFRVSIPLMFFRRQFLTDNNISLYEGIIYEDALYAFEVFSLAAITSHCHKVLYHRRYRDNSTMTSKPTVHSLSSYITVVHELISFAEIHKLNSDSTVKSYISRYGLNVYNIYDSLSATDRNSGKSAITDFVSFVKKNRDNVTAELINRTHGKLLWGAGKVIEKLKK